jgi:hypothetical protein
MLPVDLDPMPTLSGMNGGKDFLREAEDWFGLEEYLDYS